MSKKKLVTQTQLPEGLFYLPEFIPHDEERSILSVIDELPFSAYVMGAYVAKRTVVQYGAQQYRVNYGGNQPLELMPQWLSRLREQCGALLNDRGNILEQALVARYENAGIGWHRDAPQFGPVVIGISLGEPNLMRFRRMQQNEEVIFRLTLAPRSLYIMSGKARSDWQHSMPESHGVRFSVTFRTVKESLRRPGRATDGATNSSTDEITVKVTDRTTDRTRMQTTNYSNSETRRILVPRSEASFTPTAIANRLSELNLLSNAIYNLNSSDAQNVTQLSLLDGRL